MTGFYRGLRTRLVIFIRACTLPLLLLLVWYVSSKLGWLPPQRLPAPQQVASTAYDFIMGDPNGPEAYAFSGSFLQHALTSTWRVAKGFAVAAIVGVAFGLLLGANRRLESFVDPLLQIMRPIPVTAWLPLAIMWFGLGNQATVFLIFIGAVFPILINTVVGVKVVDRRLVEAAQMLGASRFALFYKVILPASLPSILAGLRVGLGFAWVCLVVGEMTGVGTGLGSAIADARELFRVDLIIVGMLLIGLIGYASDRLLVWSLRRLVRWAPSLFH